jgi:hypothetical protein
VRIVETNAADYTVTKLYRSLDANGPFERQFSGALTKDSYIAFKDTVAKHVVNEF